MKARSFLVVLGLVAAAVAGACSSSTTTYAVNGTCGPLAIGSSGVLFTIAGPCDLGQAGNFAIAATVDVTLGASGAVPVSIDAGFVQNGYVLYSKFSGTADVPDSGLLTTPIGISGTFTFQGGTGQFSDATGTAAADGGVNLGTTSANLTLVGSVTY
ncbi:MAG TPA: hypothetical protein VEJ89_16685 [Myxococcaceae bacterium]|jgi:hypothetical protein|nr:hypothetical protein [Myxococcaceae bacterium]